MKIIAFDPGVQNYAYSVLDTSSNLPTVIATGHLVNPLFSLKENDLKDGIKLYLWEIQGILNFVGFSKEEDKIIAERYLSRGSYRNAQIELVNVMLGILVGYYSDTLLVMPATWKTFIKRRYGTNDMLKLVNAETSPHIADTIGMAAYYIEKYCQQKEILNSVEYGKI